MFYQANIQATCTSCDRLCARKGRASVSMTEDTATASSSDELVTPGSMYKGNGPMKCEPNQLEPPRESFQLSVFRLRKMPLLLEEEPDNPHITLLRSLGLLSL